jgi:hypothetical protein
MTFPLIKAQCLISAFSPIIAGPVIYAVGATLADFNERYGLFEYNKKRLIKVYIPLIGWT